jgi:threonine synthase
MSFVKGLKCRECGREYPVKLLAGCEDCYGPLEVDYHYDAIASVLNRDVIASRPKSIWKYRELLPIDSDPVIGLSTGATPLIRAKRLGQKLGLNNLYLNNNGVMPTHSFKDRVTAVAINKPSSSARSRRLRLYREPTTLSTFTAATGLKSSFSFRTIWNRAR